VYNESSSNTHHHHSASTRIVWLEIHSSSEYDDLQHVFRWLVIYYYYNMFHVVLDCSAHKRHTNKTIFHICLIIIVVKRSIMAWKIYHILCESICIERHSQIVSCHVTVNGGKRSIISCHVILKYVMTIVNRGKMKPFPHRVPRA
jgi:hypothetical protein